MTIEQWQLANGLRIVVQPDARWPLVASMMCYDAGSRHDPPSRPGLAHVCEHLAFYGPRRPSGRPFPAAIERVGGSAQAITLPDRLCFASAFPAAALGDVLAVEAERMACPCDTQDDEAIEIQRRILLDELRRRAASRPLATAIEELHRMLFPAAHPYHRPPAGEADGIRAVTADDVRVFSESHMSPEHAVLVLVGDVSISSADTLIRRAFEALSRSRRVDGERSTMQAQGGPAAAAPRRLRAAVSGPQAYVAWSLPGFGQESWYLAMLLMRALTTGRNNPLTRDMTERALAQEVRGHVVSMRDASTLLLMAVAAPGVDSVRLEQGLVDAIERLLSSGVAAESIERGRTKALSDHYFTVQNLEKRADVCASLSCYLAAPERLATEPQRFLSPDRDAIAAFASTLRSHPARATLSLIPLAEPA